MSEETFTSPLASPIKRFLECKRAAGYDYVYREWEIKDFDKFLVERLSPDDPIITESIIRTYVTLTGKRVLNRLSLLRQFCRFMASEEPRTAIPPRYFLGIHQRPFVPRILTRDEGRRFLQACLHLPPGQASPLRGIVHGTMLLLLYLTGMRLGEALSLRRDDVDLSSGVVRVRKGKFGKARLVPLAQDLTDRMEQCRLSVDRYFGARPPDACFFPGPKGFRYTGNGLVRSFRILLAEAHVPYLGAGKGPRIHDLRHSYAVHRMMLWYEEGADLGAQLPILATYMGHVGLSSSQYYLRLTEDVLGGIVNRYQTRFGHLIKERRTE